MTPRLRKLLFETLYRNRYLYRFASTVPFAGQWRIWQRLILTRLQGIDILELGCGLGDLLADMLEVGYNARAVEHSPEMVDAARNTLKKRNLGQPAWIIQGVAQSLPFSNETFDSVVSTFPSEYIYDPDTIAEIARVLRPGGRVLILEGANLLPVGLLQPFLVLVQALVYGRAALFGPRKQHTLDEEMARSRVNKQQEEVITDVLPDAWFGRLIPLEQAGLLRRSERIRTRKWEVYLTIGEKKT
jgi:ubiquinone/menaquinone biosynthesis C-methylase UbiE